MLHSQCYQKSCSKYNTEVLGPAKKTEIARVGPSGNVLQLPGDCSVDRGLGAMDLEVSVLMCIKIPAVLLIVPR